MTASKTIDRPNKIHSRLELQNASDTASFQEPLWVSVDESRNGHLQDEVPDKLPMQCGQTMSNEGC
jgi:hypothetical protein